MSLALRAAAALRLNLNWLFDPRTAWQRREPLRMPKRAQVVEAPPSEIARLFVAWTAARDYVDATGGDDAEAIKRWHDIETAIFALPSRTPADLAMKLYAFGSGDVVHICEHSEPLCAEIEALVGMPQWQRRT
ncbi:hypothetical protein [Cypionkella sp. TWP1-2-1b2]|uniref:hypothetical protein n=1 Tax=Cypionkella sp. TWP1-2-1b2 TaxID=2804675 RepID=UPI003CF0D249